MLQLKDIVKDYEVSGGTVHALRNLSIAFRPNEFVSILGPSGCGKTTLLNIVGGLDRATHGDLIINGIHTDKFDSKDWDSYRNHTIGFVFQSYNLISHLSVLGNVELALTLSGYGKKERKEKALAALDKVGLSEQANKRPSQLSGGQQQRVAIARAIVNDPAIILADEPTGALDSETSVSVMELLKEIASDRLVIMVTHNPQLAEQYSTRIINLFDGQKVGDTNPYEPTDEELEAERKSAETKQQETKGTITRKNRVMGRTSMSLWTAMTLSFRNLFSKRGRTAMVSVAGSIGIIGIALILSLSQGLEDYINLFEENTLSSYPITLTLQTADVSDLMSSYMGIGSEGAERYPEVDVENNVNTSVGVTSMMFQMIDSLAKGVYYNDLTSFKSYLETKRDVDPKDGGLKGLYQAIQYSFGVNVNIYGIDSSSKGYTKLNPMSGLNMDWNLVDILDGLQNDENGQFNSAGIMEATPQLMQMLTAVDSLQGYGSMLSGMMNFNMWMEMIDNRDYILSQYDVICGELTDDPYGVVLVTDSYDNIPDVTLFSLDYLDQSHLIKYFFSSMKDSNGKALYEPYNPIVPEKVDFEVLMNKQYKLTIDPDYYGRSYVAGTVYPDHRDDNEYMTNLLSGASDIRIKAILRPKEGVTGGMLTAGGIYYSHKLVELVCDLVEVHPLVVAQKNNPQINILNGGAAFDPTLGESYSENLTKLGVADENKPSSIFIYPAGFKEKEKIQGFIDTYNQDKKDKAKALYALASEAEESGDLARAEDYRKQADKQEAMVVRYTDMVGSVISTLSTIIDGITYVLVAFVSISLLVSSIMIGIITTISVLERTKEIGVLRAIGASKQDVTAIFIAETVIIGLFAGVLGVVFTAIVNWPISLIVGALTGPSVSIVARLPVWGGMALVAVSVVLTLIAGLIPAGSAAKKDPVVALRSE